MSGLVKHWYSKSLLVWLLLPFSLLFGVITSVRRTAYALGIKKVFRPTAKVIVVGNISVGGNGKTPVVLALSRYYQEKGLRVGILSRGYGGKSSYYPRQVTPNDDAAEVGDEPRLLAIRSKVPVVVDPIRSRGAAYLSNDLHCDLIICDDGLQHYALARDAEIIVMDERLVGNGYLMPMGPLREGLWRLKTVDAIVHNRTDNAFPSLDIEPTKQYLMRLQPGRFTSVVHPDISVAKSELMQHSLVAMAGIGSPERFFTQLEKMGLKLEKTVPFPDHHQFHQDEIPASYVIMTEKDAVKVADFAHEHCWYLPVSADIDSDFYTHINNKLVSAGLNIPT